MTDHIFAPFKSGLFRLLIASGSVSSTHNANRPTCNVSLADIQLALENQRTFCARFLRTENLGNSARSIPGKILIYSDKAGERSKKI
jgi:hypothetical protein